MNKCLHCQNPLEINQVDFCCSGCEKAFTIISQNGFKNYYSTRIINPNENFLKPPNKIDSDKNSATDFQIEEFIYSNKDNCYEANLMVQDLQCGACVWLIEGLLKKQDFVVNARINLTQKTLKLIWRGQKNYGNSLLKLISEIGYKAIPIDQELITKNQNDAESDIFKALAVAGFGAGNIMLFSFALWFNDSLIIKGYTRQLLQLLSLIIALPVLIYSSRIFFISAFKSIKKGLPQMDIPIAMAIILASIVSIVQTFRAQEHVYFDSVVMLVFFLLIGRYLDFKVRKKAFNIATEFSYLQASFGRVEIDNKTHILPAKKLQEGMDLIVAVGEKIACDGIVIDGESEIDNSLITGESKPEKIIKNSLVFGGSINIGKPIKVKITKTSNRGILAEIISLINNIENKKNFYIRLADRFSKYYTPALQLLALLTFLLWYQILKSTWDIAMMNATAVLIITCPCALALAIPIVQAIAVSNFLKKGIIVKNGQALEIVNNIDCIVFDKTGSLTFGTPQLLDILQIDKDNFIDFDKTTKNHILHLAKKVAQYSSHPLSQAISNFENDIVKNNVNIKNIEEVSGSGIKANYNDIIIKIGRADFCEIKNHKALQDVENILAKNNANLKCFLSYEDKKFVIFFRDEIKNDAPDIVKFFKDLGKRIILLSGDNEAEVSRVAKICSIEEFYWCKNPIEKTQILENLRKINTKFMMIGDGLNDAPSLSLADISVSFSKAVDISQNIADIVINSSNNLYPLAYVFEYSKKALYLMRQNLFLALVYNIIAIPFAMIGMITPLLAGLAMSSSSLIVIINSLRMNLKK